METEERRKVMEEHTSSIRSIRLRAYSERRGEAFWKAVESGADSDWRKYQEWTTDFDKLCNRRNSHKRRRSNG